MSKFSEWNLAQKLQESNKKGLIAGIAIALVVVAIIILVIVKIKCIRQYIGCDECDLDDLEDDFIDELDDDIIYPDEEIFV